MADFDDIFNSIFPDGDFSGLINQFFLSSGAEPNDYPKYQNSVPSVQVDGHTEHQELPLPVQVDDDAEYQDLLSLLETDDNSHLHIPPMNGDVAEELISLLTDTWQDGLAIIDSQQPSQSSEVDGNSDLAIIAVPQQANGSENGIMYQMCPELFNFLTGTMLITQHPKANKRSRYACDGSRFLPDSRHHPTAIHLPDLQNIRLESNQVLGLVLTIVTDTNNQYNQTYVHANDIAYRVKNTEKIEHGCIFIPLDRSAIENTEQRFTRLSIIYKKYDDYTFNLVPFDASTMFGPTEIYDIPGNPKMGKVKKVKRFRQEFNLLSYKFVFHLALKQDNVIYISNITCETDVIDERVEAHQLQQRAASPSSEILSEEDDSQDTMTERAPKRFRASPPPLIGLPVYRASDYIDEPDQ